ncbi:MAG TPA: hypothetical protein VKU60_08750, partial [Chloroflexota bacterium]|nr:hypothetical protein [Chloroflexota bacterium]
AATYADFPEQIAAAISQPCLTPEQVDAVRHEVSAAFTPAKLWQTLQREFAEQGLSESSRRGFHELDIRLGRHHEIGHDLNAVDQTLESFAKLLLEQPTVAAEAIEHKLDPEEHLAALAKR